MKKLKNPFQGNPGYHCFGCSPDNLNGLNLEFFEEGDEVLAFYEPSHEFEGFNNVLHGGIQATLLDEIGSWAIFIMMKTSGVTSHMNIKFSNPVFISDGKVKLKARIKEQSRKLVIVSAGLYDHEEKILAEAEIQYYIFSPELAKNKYHYPGIERFYD